MLQNTAKKKQSNSETTIWRWSSSSGRDSSTCPMYGEPIRRSTAPFLPHHPLQPQILFALGGAVTIACGKPSGKKLLNTVCYDGGPKGTTALRWHMHCNAKLWPNSRAGVVGRVVAGCLASAGHLYHLLTVHLPP